MGKTGVVVAVLLAGVLITYKTTKVASRAVRRLPPDLTMPTPEMAAEYLRKKFPRTHDAYENVAWAYGKVATGYETVAAGYEKVTGW